MSKALHQIQKTTVAAVLAATACGIFGIQSAYAEFGHVSCQVQIQYDYMGRSEQSEVPGTARTLELDLAASEASSTLSVPTAEIMNSPGPNFPVALSLTGLHPGLSQFSSGSPVQLRFDLVNPEGRLVLPAAEARTFSLSVPFSQVGPLQSSPAIPVNWSTAVIPRYCTHPTGEFRNRVLGRINQFKIALDSSLHSAEGGWMSQMQSIQADERTASRARTSAERNRLRTAVRERRSAFMTAFQTAVGFPSPSPTASRAFITYLKQKKAQILQNLASLVIANGFESQPDSVGLAQELPALLAEYETVLSFLGVRDSALVNARHNAHWNAVVANNRAAQRSAPLRQRIIAAMLPETFGANFARTEQGFTEDAQGHEGFSVAPTGGIELGGNVCGLARVTVQSCTFTNANPNPNSSGVPGMDGGVDASAIDVDATVQNSGQSADDAAVSAPANPDEQSDQGNEGGEYDENAERQGDDPSGEESPALTDEPQE